MSTEAVVVWLGVLVAGVTGILGVYFIRNPPDYGARDANRALLDTLPVHPGSHFVEDRTNGWTTTRTFRVAGRADVVGFYTRSLRGRCIRVSLPASFRCGTARVVVARHGARYDVTVDTR